jgi:hypothetical protein
LSEDGKKWGHSFFQGKKDVPALPFVDRHLTEASVAIDEIS